MPDPGSKAAQPVTFDTSSFEAWGMAGSGHSVKMVGEIDDLWASAFWEAQHVEGHRAKFHLDRARGVMAFSTRTEGDPQKLLSELQVLLDLTNRRTGRQAAVEPSIAPSEADEDTRTEPRNPVVDPASAKRRPYRMTLEDSRGSSRLDASLTVEFADGDHVGPDSTSTGMTRDVSASGVFVETNRLPSVGDRLSLVVHLTPQNRIGLKGEVVRVLSKDEARDLVTRPGFAARVTDPSGTFAKLVESRTKAE